MPDADGPVTLQRDGDVAVLTMNRPPHNLLGPDLSDGLIDGLRQAQALGCRAVVVRSALRNFSAGADVQQFRHRGESPAGGRDPLALLKAFEGLPLPIVASVNGVALGGGFEIALACDFIVAADSAKLGLVEATIGLQPSLGGVQRVIQRAGVARGKEIVMLARRHDAATLAQWGIINRVVPAESLDEVALAFARELAAGPTVAHGCTKQLATIFLDEGLASSDAAMQRIQEPIWRSEDLRIGLASFRENGPGLARFTGR